MPLWLLQHRTEACLHEVGFPCPPVNSLHSLMGTGWAGKYAMQRLLAGQVICCQLKPCVGAGPIGSTWPCKAAMQQRICKCSSYLIPPAGVNHRCSYAQACVGLQCNNSRALCRGGMQRQMHYSVSLQRSFDHPVACSSLAAAAMR